MQVQLHKSYWLTAILFTCILVIVGCSKPDSDEVINSKSGGETAQSSTAKPLQPLFMAARACFNTCTGYTWSKHHSDTSRVLPKNFKDFIATTNYGLKGLLKLVSIWPDNYKAIAVKKPSEHAIMEMGGWMTYVMNFEGNPIYIYVQVGLPDMEMIPGPLRRVPGSLSIAVNPKTKAMAAIFIGQENLSEYRFTGDEKLLSILLAYLVADEAEQEKAYLISPSQIREDVIFPIPAERLSKVETRLSYLNGLYINGMITGARSAYDAGSDARKVPPEKQWWAANSSFTECFETGGPQGERMSV